jgi:hypothetical protein
MWSDLAAWFASPAGQRALTDAVLPVVAVLVAAVLAALIARAAVRRLERKLDREALAAAIAGFTEVARRTGSTGPERIAATRLAAESDVRLRLSGRPGADLAAEWALLVSLAARGEDAAVVRDRLLEWARKPRRARRLFGNDLDALHQTEPAPERPAEAPRREPEQPSAARLPAERPATARAVVAPPSAERDLVEQPAAVAATDHTNQVQRQAEPESPEAEPQAQPEPQPLQPAASAPARPSWLDDYDDDAHVTRNIPLSTPAPVSASAVRDRSRPGDDIVPS